ncbi:MAG TPA: hypothetical protein VFE67_04770 [Rudaea sp.]|nr:hypothetical protein [Rudaea sp.]
MIAQDKGGRVRPHLQERKTLGARKGAFFLTPGTACTPEMQEHFPARASMTRLPEKTKEQFPARASMTRLPENERAFSGECLNGSTP